MSLVPQQRKVLSWVQPTLAQRYEIYSELGLPRAVLTINDPTNATLETRLGTYLITRRSFASQVITDADGSFIAEVQSGWWWGRRRLRFHDGRVLRFGASNLFRSRWLWSSDDGDPRAVVQRNQIFFSPEWPIQEGLSSLLTGLTIYFIIRKPSHF